MTALPLSTGAVGGRRTAAIAAVAALLAAAPALAPAGVALAERGGTWSFDSTTSSRADGPAVIDPAVLAATTETVEVVLTAAPGAGTAAARLVTRTGGTVGKALPLVDGFVALVRKDSLAALGASDAVRAVTLDREVRFEQYAYDDGHLVTDALSGSTFAKSSGASAAWSQGRNGLGIGVAVIDTGISPTKDFTGRLVHGPDLSGEGSTVDSYGHGTVMAGAIGGSGADSRLRVGGAHTGVAPKATLVSVKAAGRNGVTDVSTMLEAMHWVSAYADEFNIRVVNISWGTTSSQDPAVDPLNYAVQRLWSQGIVVVVAAGNSGPGAGTITKPGDDPVVLTVGAYDDRNSLRTDDDALPSWTSRGPTAHGLVKPDLVAPGRTIVSQRSHGSHVEINNPKALISPSYIKGSGSSQAAAVTSGVVALLLESRPELTPDQVKAVLTGTALPLPSRPATDQGSGRIKLGAALTAEPGAAVQQELTASGLGSLEASRGGRNVVSDCDGDGVAELIKGELTVTCADWNGAAWTGAAWTGAAWTGAHWTGAAWTSTGWTGGAWTGAAWTGAAWTGGAWTGAAWTGAAWTGAAWTGAAWTGAAWTGAAWTGAAWTTAEYGDGFTTAAYDTEDDPSFGVGEGFMTGFWGDKTKHWKHLPGEAAEDRPQACEKPRHATRHSGRCAAEPTAKPGPGGLEEEGTG